jgi:hypothetical protein
MRITLPTVGEVDIEQRARGWLAVLVVLRSGVLRRTDIWLHGGTSLRWGGPGGDGCAELLWCSVGLATLANRLSWGRFIGWTPASSGRWVGGLGAWGD